MGRQVIQNDRVYVLVRVRLSSSYLRPIVDLGVLPGKYSIAIYRLREDDEEIHRTIVLSFQLFNEGCYRISNKPVN